MTERQNDRTTERYVRQASLRELAQRILARGKIPYFSEVFCKGVLTYMFVTHVTVGKTRKLSAKIFKSLRFSRTLERQLINSVTTELQQLSSVNDQ